MDNNRIKLISEFGRQDEAVAAAVFKPGHILEMTSADKVQKHSQYGGRPELMVALEDALQGNTIDDAYAADDVATFFRFLPGDVAALRVPAGALSITKGDKLISDGAGCVIKSPTSGGDILYENVADSAAIGTSSTAEAAFDKTYTVPANTLKVGDILRVRAAIKVTGSNSTDTLTLKLKIASQVVIATAAVDVADNDVGFIDAIFIIRTIGASGTFVASGLQGLGVPGTVTGKPWYLGSTALDTTATLLISVTGQMSASSAGNTVVLQSLVVSKESNSDFGPVVMSQETVDNSAGSAEVFCKCRFLN